MTDLNGRTEALAKNSEALEELKNQMERIESERDAAVLETESIREQKAHSCEISLLTNEIGACGCNTCGF